jgi:hypothetical protein
MRARRNPKRASLRTQVDSCQRLAIQRLNATRNTQHGTGTRHARRHELPRGAATKNVVSGKPVCAINDNYRVCAYQGRVAGLERGQVVGGHHRRP